MDAISFEAVTQVEAGRDHPSVTFRSGVEGKLSVRLTCAEKSFTVLQAVRPGAVHTVSLTGLPIGPSTCTGLVRIDEPNGAFAEAPLRFEVALLSVLEWAYGAGDVDLDARTLIVHPSRALKEASLELVGVGGVILAVETATLIDPQRPTFSWTTEEEVLKLVVTGTDEAGIRARLELSPWYYAIPHEDVVFASGSAEIQGSEAPKLERCWTDIARVLQKYGSVVDIRLYVAGYTDTVGSSASNQSLSERRARAIASWFARRGFPGAVASQGFGEDALAISTPDETDALPNRRAVYVLAAGPPPPSHDLPLANWQPL